MGAPGAPESARMRLHLVHVRAGRRHGVPADQCPASQDLRQGATRGLADHHDLIRRHAQGGEELAFGRAPRFRGCAGCWGSRARWPAVSPGPVPRCSRTAGPAGSAAGAGGGWLPCGRRPACPADSRRPGAGRGGPDRGAVCHAGPTPGSSPGPGRARPWVARPRLHPFRQSLSTVSRSTRSAP